MEREFNLIENTWIRVLTKDIQVKEVSLKDVFLNAHEYIELSGETKTQDFAILRFLLAIMYTVFSGYENFDEAYEKWLELWENKHFPIEPFESYFEKWRDRFWLFDDEHPFYQSKAAEGQTKNTSAKMIGSLFESANKNRLFAERKSEGRLLSYSEAARWLLHLNCFDDIAAKHPTPKRSWVGELGLIALKGDNLFETLMLNFYITCDIERDIFNETPSWEQDDNNKAEFNREIPVPDNQAALLSLMSRKILLCRDSDSGLVSSYYLGAGDYFTDIELFDNENMTLWLGYKEKSKKNSVIKFIPRRHNPETKMWQEFGSIVGVSDKSEITSKRPGILKWFDELCKNEVVDYSYVLRLESAAVIYNYNQATSLPVIDSISDNLSFHAELLRDLSEAWINSITMEIKNCDSAAYYIRNFYKYLQMSCGRKDKDLTTILSGEREAEVQFYDSIDRPFRLWLEELRTEQDIEEYSAVLERKMLDIALKMIYSISRQAGTDTIFIKEEKEQDKKEKKKKIKIESSAKLLNMYEALIRKVFAKAGVKK